MEDAEILEELSPSDLLKEIRCCTNPNHRLIAAKKLFKEEEISNRITYLCDMVLFDPDPQVASQVKSMLKERYGKELESMLRVEGCDGKPIEEPWMLPCQQVVKMDQFLDADIEEMVNANDLNALYEVLRDPKDVNRRIQAAKTLAEDHSEMTSEMLAKSVLLDPDENVQQQSYISLYEAAGKEKADRMLDQIGAKDPDDSEDWLPENENTSFSTEIVSSRDDSFSQQEEPSLFGISKSDQLRGLVQLLTTEKDAEKRLKILKSLAKSSNFNANMVLARIALFDADLHLREVAREELDNKLGDKTPDFLDHVYQTSMAYYADPDNETEEETQTRDQLVQQDDFFDQVNSQPPVMEEGRSFSPFVILCGLVIMAILIYFILR